MCVIDWQKAIILWYRQQFGYNKNIEIIDFYSNDYIKSTNKDIRVPSIMRITKYCNVFNRHIKFSRRNLFIRDNYTCQYCGKKLENKKLTYDHIIPKSKWSNHNTKATNWLNITTACVSCNLKKGDKTPQQASMPLLNIPYIPLKNEKYLPIAQHLLNIEHIPNEWSSYISSYLLLQ